MQSMSVNSSKSAHHSLYQPRIGWTVRMLAISLRYNPLEAQIAPLPTPDDLKDIHYPVLD